jgi:hypothetical protein
MTNSKQKAKFSDGKLFWMTVLALLLSIAALVIMTFYIVLKNNNDRLAGESEMKFQIEMYQLKVCYNNDIKPCTLEAIQEFNKENNYQ